jgi:glycosyltransferase involved in cell wall biosynthesis
MVATGSRRISVCFVIGTLDRGGAEGQLVRLATHLPREQFDVSVCCLADGGPLQGVLDAAGIPVDIVGLHRPIHSLLPFKSIGRLVQLSRVIQARQPDIVHGFLFWAYVLGTAAAKVGGVPVVVASRRSLSHFKASRPDWRILEQLANAATDAIVANSEAVRDDVLKHERIPPSKLSVIYNGVDAGMANPTLRREVRRTLRIGDQDPVIAVVANLIHYKGHEHFFQALPEILGAFPRAVVLLAGDGPERARSEQRVRTMGMANAVRFLGVRSDVPALLEAADLLVHPSLEEGFSNAVLEAMAAGRPVVATSVGGNAEAVVDGDTGLLVAPADPPALASAAIWLLRHPAEARAMGESGRARVTRHFEIDRMVRGYERLYRELLAARVPAWKPREDHQMMPAP